ncbi:MAG: DUF294 nucleotidyltransferase-like domain-containing protein [Armatimonadota bacterium]
MKVTMRVDLHCHSIYSDGIMTPREIAEALADSGITIAALTDHDSIDGLAEFNRVLARRDVSCITGLEITTQYNGEETHLLAYGFDPANPELQAVLRSLRQNHTPHTHSIAGSIRRQGSLPNDETASDNAAPNGRIDIGDAIALVHRAGGHAFLAHPLVLQPDLLKLESLVSDLKEKGLDGIEAIYESFTDDQCQSLCDMAKRLELLVSAGTDFHDPKSYNSHPLGIDMPTELWKQFRDAVFSVKSKTTQSNTIIAHKRPHGRLNWRDFSFHFIFPTLIAIALFITAIYAVFLPKFEKSLLDRKREMIKELTNSAWSILNSYEKDERSGKITRAQAQAMAISRIEILRYGRESKDYFWLQDMKPRMIMHPYRRDLNGKDVSGFRDPRGVQIFVEFADLVRRGREGYVEYVWQWKDDPSRLVPKESYIKGFQPWGWIIGTGIYIEDVKQEIKLIERSLVRTALGITIIVILLLLYVIRQSLELERERADADESLYESTERYRSLVEATTEGTLLVIDNRCRYANPIFLEMIGAAQDELELLDLVDLFPRIKDNETAWSILNRLLDGEDSTDNFDAILKRRDDILIDCVITTSRISFAEKSGFILIVKNISTSKDESGKDNQWRYLQQVVNAVPVGLFRARASSRGTLIEYNQVAEALLSSPGIAADSPITLADIFPDVKAYEEFMYELQRKGETAYKLNITTKDPGSKTILISAVLAKDDQGNPHYIDGVVEDVTVQDKHEIDLEEVIEKLQTSLLFLHEPVSQIGRSAVFCKLNTPIINVAIMMTNQQSSAALIQSENNDVIGIVTDKDIRDRVVSSDINHQEQIHKIMSSPLVTISEHAEIYEALLLMEQKHVQHLAVADDTGRIIGVINNRELLQFRSYGPIILSREVQQAVTPEEVVKSCKRIPELAKALLDSGARPHHITRMVSSVCDAATVRFITMAEEKLGPAPVPYVFLALGSHGRQEMTLSSDQDNAIIYSPPSNPEELPQAENYLNELSSFVCEWLERAGYPSCPGGVMARNPRWCKPINVWKQYFNKWINLPEPQQLLEFTIFFDFRPVYGSIELSNDLRRYVFDTLHTQPSFYPHFAQNSLLFRPPTRLFGRILSGGAGGEHQGVLDLKDALMPLVSFARLYALQLAIDDTNTLDRLDKLVTGNMLQETSRQDIKSAYSFLMRLRLQHQASMLTSNQTADNIISYRGLGQTDQILLNQSFTQIAAVQKRISYDFLGGIE